MPRPFLLILCGVLAVSGTTVDLPAQSSPTRVYLKLPRKGEAILKAGSVFRHYRFGLEFQLPVKSRARLMSRGNFPLVEIRPVESRRFIILHTTFQIRRPDNLARVSRIVSGPCPLPSLPEKDGRVVVTCVGRVGLNRVERKIHFIRAGDLLHLFYITYRLDSRAFAKKIIDSIKRNDKIYQPGYSP